MKRANEANWGHVKEVKEFSLNDMYCPDAGKKVTSALQPPHELCQVTTTIVHRAPGKKLIMRVR